MDAIRSQLAQQKTDLTAELERMSAPPEETGSISFGKRVGEGTSMAVDRLVQVETYEQLRRLLGDVTRSLEKLDEDTYGVCDRCGTAIPPERLEILPWAVVCVRCAE